MEYMTVNRDQSLTAQKNSRNQKIKKAFKSGLNWIMANNNRITTEKKIRSEKIIADARAYDILC